jgi:hypothetical protein
MKLELNYEITEFTEADAMNFNAVRDRFMHFCHTGVML